MTHPILTKYMKENVKVKPFDKIATIPSCFVTDCIMILTSCLAWNAVAVAHVPIMKAMRVRINRQPSSRKSHIAAYIDILTAY